MASREGVRKPGAADREEAGAALGGKETEPGTGSHFPETGALSGPVSPTRPGWDPSRQGGRTR